MYCYTDHANISYNIQLHYKYPLNQSFKKVMLEYYWH